ncbi:MAG: PA2169 family four-helix-bundle protein [Myxococcales bacterium]|nr:PA2169 family four-helix-bundle protein [Myxococcales bacterium]MCB9736009.1 PA2169 family four-helix-bundle protein [Deltaproteobacteria bacterium]
METVTHMREDTLDGLRDLIRINLDAKKGFEESAKELDSAAIKSLFLGCAAERDSQAAELRRYVELNDEDATDSGSAKGAIHRAWLKFRAALAGDTDLAVLDEAERGEDKIKELYEEVIVETAGSPVNDVLHRHIAQVKKRHDQIRDLRDAMAQA